MSNEMITFTTPAELGGLDVRVTHVNGQELWRLDDLCRLLDHANPRQAAARLDEDETATVQIVDISPSGIVQTRNVTFVTEAGVWSLITTSRSPLAKPTKRWLTHEVLPSLRKHGIYVVGQERVRTGELSVAELGKRAADAYKSLAEALEADNKRLQAENVEVRRVNAAMTDELTMVTIQEWKGLNHKCLDAHDTNRISSKARALADARGITLVKVPRDVPIGRGFTIKSAVNVYPRELLDEAAAALGFTFMREVVPLSV